MKQNLKTVILCVLMLCILSPTVFPIEIERIGGCVEVIRGPVNGVLVRHGEKILAIYGDPRDEPVEVDTVLFTHHRRDVVWAGQKLVLNGAKAIIPAYEENLFTDIDKFWDNFQETRFHDYEQQTTKILTESLPIAATVSGGQTLNWEGIPIRVLSTPGYTRGSVSYVLELEGKRIAFTGDLIYGDGRLLDLYSFQDAIPEAKIGGYHGFAARCHELVESLNRIAEQQPDLIIPARGPTINDVPSTISKLVERVRAVYANYLCTDALRWYFGDEHIRTKAERVLGPDAPVKWMAFAETIHDRPPDWILPISNSRLIFASDGAGFLVDCGSARIIQKIKELMQEGRLHSVDGLYITHYHDDHTDQAASFAEEFKCPVYACEEMQDILRNPHRYRLPCLTKNPIPDLKVMSEGSTLQWKEFELSFYYFPGQTIYHGGLLVKKRSGEVIFFIGDSFTPCGIDDYCLLNRNVLRSDAGYFYCLNRLREMKLDYLLTNQHVEPTFRFSVEQLDFMRETLEKRVELLRGLFPWDDPNYGLDERWVGFYPYEQHVSPGSVAALTLKVTNYSPRPRSFHVRLQSPEDWKGGEVKEIIVGAREEGGIRFEVVPPSEANAGLYLITADVQTDGMDLRRWTEALVVIDEE